MALFIGIFLALTVGILARLVGLDRDRSFYPTVMIVIASYYGLFAVMGGSSQAVVAETLAAAAFLVLAIVGFKRSMWIVAAALAGHGVFDGIHGHVIANPGVPGWWPQFCMAYDITAGAFLAWLLRAGRMRASAEPSVLQANHEGR